MEEAFSCSTAKAWTSKSCKCSRCLWRRQTGQPSSCPSPFLGLCSLPQPQGRTQRRWIQPTLSTALPSCYSFPPLEFSRNGFLPCLSPCQLQGHSSLALQSPSVMLLYCLPWLCSLFWWKQCCSTSHPFKGAVNYSRESFPLHKTTGPQICLHFLFATDEMLFEHGQQTKQSSKHIYYLHCYAKQFS